MKLLFLRNEWSQENKASAIELGTFLILWMLMLAIFATGPLGEHIARNWIVALTCAATPINRLSIHWAKKAVLVVVIGFTIVPIQAFIAYELRHYLPTGDISHGWLMVSLIVYFTMSWIAWAIGQYFTGGLPKIRSIRKTTKL